MADYELKMVVSKKIKLDDNMNPADITAFFEEVIASLTKKAKESKVNVMGDFLYLGLDDLDRDIEEKDLNNVFFLGAITNECN